MRELFFSFSRIKNIGVTGLATRIVIAEEISGQF